MTIPKTLGLPRMRNEAGERRVFLPPFVQFIAGLGINVHIEEGYGSRSGYSFDEYKLANPLVHMTTHRGAFAQDAVLILRSPKPDELALMKPGAILFSMLHFPTRPLRVRRLQDAGIKAISMDSVVNDNSIRLVENMKAVAWNGLEAAFDVLEQRWPGLVRPDKKPVRSLVLGTGMVGKYAVDAATKFGRVERNSEHMANAGPGAMAMAVGRNLSTRPSEMEALIGQADILVDSTQRRDTSKPVIPNEWISWLPEHAVIADLAVDPYTLNAEPPVVRGVEGIPQGNLDQYIFAADDANWDKTVPATVNSTNRRATVSCYSWPGVHPEACMTHYAEQLKPFMEILFQEGYDGLSLAGEYFERALCRATLNYFVEETRIQAEAQREAAERLLRESPSGV